MIVLTLFNGILENCLECIYVDVTPCSLYHRQLGRHYHVYKIQYKIRLIKVDRTQLIDKTHIQSVRIFIQLSDNKMPVTEL